MEIRVHSKSKLVLGLSLIVLGIACPLWLTVDTFRVTQTLYLALQEQGQVIILEAAFRLALLNAVRCYPHYLGAFFVAEAFSIYKNGRPLKLVNIGVVIGLIALVYQLIELIYHVHYDFGVPALALAVIQMLIWLLNYSYISPMKKIPMMVLFLTSLQFLDVMPLLDKMPFGRGETSQNIKVAASVLEMESYLNSVVLVFFLMFFSMGVLMFLLLRDENRMLQINELRDQNERILVENRIKDMENRTTWEMQHLVHDLKTPLTSIQTLAWVVKTHCDSAEHAEARSHLERIEHSVDQMSNMISEILYEDHKLVLTTKEMLDIVLAQLSVSPYAACICVENHAGESLIYVNSIRMARAIINLTENAWHARRDGDSFRLTITVDQGEGDHADMVRMEITDNGVGIDSRRIESVWTRGTSSKGSSGLGLHFVREMVEQSQGKISLHSTDGVGTTVTIYLPKGDESDE